ncbi:MAG: hypothetical protein D6761_11740 [Candidatus Dadabacteria bacterium]|nr:MAG: hypothetical protein D6761_11740 [Candidatus Dadabacteria bacterium]
MLTSSATRTEQCPDSLDGTVNRGFDGLAVAARRDFYDAAFEASPAEHDPDGDANKFDVRELDARALVTVVDTGIDAGTKQRIVETACCRT